MCLPLGGKVCGRWCSELERAMSVCKCVRHVEAAGRALDIALATRAALVSRAPRGSQARVWRVALAVVVVSGFVFRACSQDVDAGELLSLV